MGFSLKKNKRNFLISLIIVLVVLISCGLFACNKTAKPTEREQAVNEFKNGFMIACNNSWSYLLSKSEVENLSNEAHYIYQKALTDMYALAIDKSGVRTQKIKALANALKTDEELQKLIRSEKFDSTKLVNILDELSFTGADYTGVVVSVLKEWINGGYSLTEKVLSALTARKDSLGVSVSAEKKKEFSEVIGDVEMLNSGLISVESDKSEILADVESSEKDLLTLIDFVVNIKGSLDLSSIANFGNLVTDGQISSKSVDEVYTYIQGLFSAIETLTNELEPSKLVGLSETVNKLKNVFGGIYTSDSVLNAINNYLAIGSTCIDYVPLVSYIAEWCGKCIDKPLVKSFMEIYTQEVPVENYGLVIGKFAYKFFESTAAASLKEKAATLSEAISGDIDKIGYAWMVLNAAFEQSELKLGDKSEYLSEVEQKKLSALVVFSLVRHQYLSNVIAFDLRAKLDPSISVINGITTEISWFKSIKKYVLDDDVNPSGIARSLIESLSQYEDSEGNPTVGTVCSWAKAIYEAGNTLFGQTSKDYAARVAEVINNVIDKFYENSTTYKELADMYDSLSGNYVQSDSESYDKLCTLYNEASIEFILKLLGIVQ